MYTIDEKNRSISVINNKRNIITINEFDKIKMFFLLNTADQFECELVFLDVTIYEDEEKTTISRIETRPFTRKITDKSFIMNFEERDYIFDFGNEED